MKVIVVVVIAIAVAAIAAFALLGGGRTLPTGDAAGVDLPRRVFPAGGKPYNPYVERKKPQPAPKADQSPSGGGQSWGN